MLPCLRRRSTNGGGGIVEIVYYCNGSFISVMIVRILEFDYSRNDTGMFYSGFRSGKRENLSE